MLILFCFIANNYFSDVNEKLTQSAIFQKQNKLPLPPIIFADNKFLQFSLQ